MPSLDVRIERIETIVTRLDKHLIGEDGNGGVIQQLKEADEAIATRHLENREDLQKVKGQIKMGVGVLVGVIAVLSFVTGNGVAGLEHVLKLFGI